MGRFLKIMPWGITVCAVASLILVFFNQGGSTTSALSSVILPLLGFKGVFWLFEKASAWYEDRHRSPGAAPIELDEAAHSLRDKVLEQWKPEFQLHGLDHPGPMPVAWTKSRKLDKRSSNAQTSVSNWRTRATGDASEIIARSDAIKEFANRFRQRERLRMAIIGGSGSGKTTFSLLLMRELLESATGKEPVPVLINLAGWDPIMLDRPTEGSETPSHTLGEDFFTWLGHQINKLYPNIHTRLRDTAPAELVKNGRILPIIDGLDEMPPEHLDDAVRSLSGSISRGQGFILALRDDGKHLEAMRTYADFLVDTLVVESKSLTEAEAISYLRNFRRTRTENWELLLQALENNAVPSLSRAITNPLVLWLLYKVYTETLGDPADLLETLHFSDESAVRDHLLDHLIEATINTDRIGRQVRRAPQLNDPTRARRYLKFLAEQMETVHSRGELRWWRLGIRSQISRRLFGGWLQPGKSLEVDFQWYQKMSGRKLDRYTPGSVNLKAKGRSRSLLSAVSNGFPLIVGIPSMMLVTGVAASFVEDNQFDFSSAFLYGLPVALLSAYFCIIISGALAVCDWATQPLANTPTRTPSESLKEDMRLTGFRFLFTVVLCGGLTGIIGAFVRTFLSRSSAVHVPIDFMEGFLRGVLVSLPVGLFIATLLTVTTPTVRYFVVVTILAIQRKTPWRLMSFLESAQRLGILRLVGPSYQFAHVSLQDRLGGRTNSFRHSQGS